MKLGWWTADLAPVSEHEDTDARLEALGVATISRSSRSVSLRRAHRDQPIGLTTTAYSAARRGVSVLAIEAGSIADRAGLKPGDLLYAVNGIAPSRSGAFFTVAKHCLEMHFVVRSNPLLSTEIDIEEATIHRLAQDGVNLFTTPGGSPGLGVAL